MCWDGSAESMEAEDVPGLPDSSPEVPLKVGSR